MSVYVSGAYKKARLELKNGELILVKMIKNTKGPQYSHFGLPLGTYAVGELDNASVYAERLQETFGGVIKIMECVVHYEGQPKEVRRYKPVKTIGL